MPVTLRLTGSGVNAESLFLPRKKEGGVYTGDSHWGVVVPRGVLPEANSLQSFNTLLTQINSR